MKSHAVCADLDKDDLELAEGFEAKGFVIQPLLNDRELQTIRTAVHEYIDRVSMSLLYPYEDSHPKAGLEERLELIAARDRSIAETLLQAVMSDAQRDERMQSLQTHPRLLDMASRLMGCPVRASTLRIRANLPSFPELRQQWHTDVVLLDGGDCATIKLACWIPLMDVDGCNGALEVIPGKNDAPPTHAKHRGHVINENWLRDKPREIVECPAGHALFIDRFTPHRAILNASKSIRWSVVLWMKS